ncbi:hypothetical protein BKA57DRAFT_27698 [Linnemannia elongata]|nr:hypothetical protein BKA57DRAFT_27698 [Linnemannia elongata]
MFFFIFRWLKIFSYLTLSLAHSFFFSFLHFFTPFSTYPSLPSFLRYSFFFPPFTSRSLSSFPLSLSPSQSINPIPPKLIPFPPRPISLSLPLPPTDLDHPHINTHTLSPSLSTPQNFLFFYTFTTLWGSLLQTTHTH